MTLPHPRSTLFPYTTLFRSVAEIYPQVQQGAMRALAVTGAKRAEAFPDVPTLSQVGFPGIEFSGWVGLLAPRSEEHTSELQSHVNLVCRLLLEKKKTKRIEC